MCAEHSRARRGQPRLPVPQDLPDDLYDYGDDPAPPAPRGEIASFTRLIP